MSGHIYRDLAGGFREQLGTNEMSESSHSLRVGDGAQDMNCEESD